MKDQYVGDIGDYGKYGLLRFLAEGGIRIGVNWYLTENDGSADGKFTKYLEKEEESRFDEDLFEALKKIACCKDKSVQMVEEAGIIPGAVFFGKRLESRNIPASKRELNRRLWFNNSTICLKDADLIFADPDNGISYLKTARNVDSEKFVLPCEVADYYNSGKNVVFYCHKGRRKQEEWEKTKAEIKSYVMDAQILAVTCHRGTQRSYIFVVHPDDYARYEELITAFLASEWGDRFFDREEVTGSPSFGVKRQTDMSCKVSLETLALPFSVCKVEDYSDIDLEKPFVFTGSTDQERSLVCPTDLVPENVLVRDDGWRAFRICGVLDFSLIGILAGISGVLAENRIGIFAISTYNTDYVLTKEENFEKAIQVLQGAGYRIVG